MQGELPCRIFNMDSILFVLCQIARIKLIASMLTCTCGTGVPTILVPLSALGNSGDTSTTRDRSNLFSAHPGGKLAPAPLVLIHTMDVLPSTQPVATLGSSFIFSSFDKACTCYVPVGAAERWAGGGGMLILAPCAACIKI